MKSLFFREMQAFIRYEDLSGDNPANIYIPGLGIAAGPTFTSILHESQALGKQRSVLIDLLGTGFSDGPDNFSYSLEEHAVTVASLLDGLGLKGCGVIGYSMGGAVAITLASIRPDLVSRLVLMEANLDPGGGGASKPIADQTEEGFCTDGFQAFVNFWREKGISGDMGMAVVAGLIQVNSPHALYRSSVGLVKGTQPTMRERLYKMGIPRAYIFGENSLPNPDWDELGSHGIQVLSVPNAAHLMAFENPRGVGEALNTALTA
jgi:pimeloyl-ACP methyl ester carboxylesterase